MFQFLQMKQFQYICYFEIELPYKPQILIAISYCEAH